MRSFIYKTIIISIVIVFIYNMTLSKPINRILDIVNKIEYYSEDKKQLRSYAKQKFKEELKRSINKEKIFKEEDRLLLKEFIEKVLKELDIKLN